MKSWRIRISVTSLERFPTYLRETKDIHFEKAVKGFGGKNNPKNYNIIKLGLIGHTKNNYFWCQHFLVDTDELSKMGYVIKLASMTELEGSCNLNRR